jgi:hypothetical protein
MFSGHSFFEALVLLWRIRYLLYSIRRFQHRSVVKNAASGTFASETQQCFREEVLLDPAINPRVRKKKAGS